MRIINQGTPWAFEVPDEYTAIFDIESNGLIPQMTRVHCLCIHIKETGQLISATDDLEGRMPVKYALEILKEATTIVGHNIVKFDVPAIQKLYPEWTPEGKIYDTFLASTIIFADMKERDYARRDLIKRREGQAVMNVKWPGSLIGRHGLDAWGIRLGEWKGDYAKVKGQTLIDEFHAEHMRHREMGKLVKDCPPKKPTKDQLAEYVWRDWNIEMQDYCDQDVAVTLKLYDLFLSKNYSDTCLDMEHDFLQIMQKMEVEGFPYDRSKGEALERTLSVRMAEIGAELQEAFPPWTVETPFTPKSNNKARGYKAGVPTVKVKHFVFNPGSRDHIASRLIAKYDWQPTKFQEADKGKPSVDEEVLAALPYEEAPLLAEAMMISKRLGQLSEGNQAILKLLSDAGRIHHSINTNGTVTGRGAHSRPNVGQTVSVKSPYGKEMREGYGPPKGKKQVGADLSGLELRCLGHFLAPMDEGAYIALVLDGDVHSFNAAGLFGFDVAEFEEGLTMKDTLLVGFPKSYPDAARFLRSMSPDQQAKTTVADFFKFLRENAKTFIYGFLYGGGAEKVGSIVEKGAAEGKKLINNFLDATPAIRQLRKQVEGIVSRYVYNEVQYLCKKTNKLKKRREKVPNKNYRSYLKGIDGRHIPVRSPHAAVNSLLQCAGAVLAKKAGVLIYHEMIRRGYVWGTHWAFMAWVHDEFQGWADPEIAEEFGEVMVWAFEEAGRFYDFRCPITGEYKVGDNWYETH